MDKDTIRILLLEDDADFAFSLRKLLEKDPGLHIVDVAASAELGVKLAQEVRPDLVLVDLLLHSGEPDGAYAARQIRQTTDAKVLLLTSVEEENAIIRASMTAYASGYIKKSSVSTLPARIRETMTTTTPEALFIKKLVLSKLTEAEDHLLQLLLEGRTPYATPKTTANQKTSIYRKLGVHNQKELGRVMRNF